MRIFEITLNYDCMSLTAEQLDVVRSVALQEPAHGDPDKDGRTGLYGSFMVAERGLAQVAGCGLGFAVKKTTLLDESGTASPAFEQRETGAFNARVQVHVAGLGLLNVTEVENHNDCCTDALQSKLAEGWRILAVCVQPDQRRPDYILGRSREPQP